MTASQLGATLAPVFLGAVIAAVVFGVRWWRKRK